jgi:ABC-type polysaccharide transport system permease subunit
MDSFLYVSETMVFFIPLFKIWKIGYDSVLYLAAMPELKSAMNQRYWRSHYFSENWENYSADAYSKIVLFC